MAASAHFHGARARLSFGGKTIGIWNSCDIDWAYDVRSSYIMGRISPAALTTVGTEPVNIRAGGWVVVDHSFFQEGTITNLKDLLNQEGIDLIVEDRQGNGGKGKHLCTVYGCKPTGSSLSMSSKELATGMNTYLGLYLEFEDTQSEPEGSTSLPV